MSTDKIPVLTLEQRIELQRVARFGARLATQASLRRAVDGSKPTIEQRRSLSERERHSLAYLRDLYLTDEEDAS